MRVIREFDPWKSPLCTCRMKYSLNPYTGCYHGCLYCYSTYIPDFYNLRIKKDLERKILKDLERLQKGSLISISNSSDPYPPIEKELTITRRAIDILLNSGMRILIVTKSNIVTRDSDLLSSNSAVSISVTSLRDSFQKKFEPRAPNPEKRISALKQLNDVGIPVILRLDPILPFINENEIERIIDRCSFVDHVVSSTLKLRYDSFNRLKRILAEKSEIYRDLYFTKGEKIQSSFYLPRKIRERILLRVKAKCEELGLSYAFCREGFKFSGESCDGSHLT